MSHWTATTLRWALVVFALGAVPASAADFPTRPIELVLGFGAGGASDFLGRTLGEGMKKELGVNIVVQNRAGASGIIAAGLVNQAPPDGYSILLISSSFLNNVALGGSFDFNPMDFAHVAEIATIPNIVTVPASSPVNSVADLIAAMKKNPKMMYASGGIGTGTHLGTELFLSMTDTKAVHIPYKGTQPALIDLMAGRIEVMFAGASPALPLIKAGKLKALAVTSAQPSSVMPDLPAVSKFVPGYDAVTWYAVLAPKGTPKEIIATLNGAINRALATPRTKETLEKAGFDPMISTPDQVGALFEKELKETKEIAAKAHITLQPPK